MIVLSLLKRSAMQPPRAARMATPNKGAQGPRLTPGRSLWPSPPPRFYVSPQRREKSSFSGRRGVLRTLWLVSPEKFLELCLGFLELCLGFLELCVFEFVLISTLLWVLRTLVRVLRTLVRVLRTLVLVLRTLVRVLRTLFCCLAANF